MQLTSQLTKQATGLRTAPRRTSVGVLRPDRCRVARITAEFVKQGDSPAPSKPAQPAKPDTNGAPKETPVVVVEAPKPAAQQQDALADLQDLRKLIDEVRL
jgi:hypothetical protein